MKKLNRRQVSIFLILIGLFFAGYSFLPYIGGEVWYQFLQFKNQKYALQNPETVQNGDAKEELTVFGKIMSNKDIMLKPVNTDFALVIEKIGLNAPIVMGVSVTDEKKYLEALNKGIAHALVSDLPSNEPGNVYLFAHTSFNYWALGPYASTFNLLRKVKEGDEINVFYHEKRYLYKVVNREILPGWNTYPLTRPVIEPLLTLQTCDPPGTTLNRLVVTAKLVKVL